MRGSALFLVAAALLARASVSAEVYQCDIDGRKVFQDFPCEPGSPKRDSREKAPKTTPKRAVNLSDDIEDLKKCTAAALKVSPEVFGQWLDFMEKQYEAQYRDRLSQKQISDLTTRKILDTRNVMSYTGYTSGEAFRNYFDQHCAHIIPE